MSQSNVKSMAPAEAQEGLLNAAAHVNAAMLASRLGQVRAKA
jgi:hypothetical protein